MRYVIDFVLFPNALGLDITGPLEVFYTASAVLKHQQKTNFGYITRFVAKEKGPIRLSSGLEIVANIDFTDNSNTDILLVPGGKNIRNLINDPDLMNYLSEKASQVKRIISVCEGAFLLAAAELLKGKLVTTHWLAADDLAKQYPSVQVKSDAIFIKDGNIYTSAGVTAGIDLALSIVEEDFGVEIAMEVARLLVLYYRRPGTQSQYSSPLKAQETAGSRFSSLHKWLIDNLHKAVTIYQMAEFMAMSERNFSRVFKSVTNMTPNSYLELLRLDRARELMTAGNVPLDKLAEMCGFGREETLRRAFLRRFGVTPSQYRMHFMKDNVIK